MNIRLVKTHVKLIPLNIPWNNQCHLSTQRRKRENYWATHAQI